MQKLSLIDRWVEDKNGFSFLENEEVKGSLIKRLNTILNSQKENLDYRYDVKAYKEYLKELLKYKDEKDLKNFDVLSFEDFWGYDIDYKFEDYEKIKKILKESSEKEENFISFNGGPGSGNFNPGQGRGVGKPADGQLQQSETQYSSNKYLSKKEYENIVNYVNDDNFTEEELDAIASYAESMGYGASCELNQAIKENDFGEIEERETLGYPEDDSQIVTWKENRELIEQKIKDKKQHDAIEDTIDLAVSTFRKDDKSNEKDREALNDFIKKQKEEMNKLYKSYSEYENYIKNYENGLYKDIKDDQKMWTINEDNLSKVSLIKLREKQKTEPKRFKEVLEIPRLMWSTYYKDKPTTSDTLVNKFGRDFENLDRLDKIIKDKGFILDRDITVTRRVANAKVIENQIKNKGKYTQNGITSVTAAKSISKRMPSGVHMGDDLLRITIPKGTRIISTYNPFVMKTQKSADKYNNGKLTEEDNRNLRMIKGQNEFILPSGSNFISPDGNKFIQNEDGSYQLILETEKSNNSISRNQRLNIILNKINNGAGNPYHDEKGKFTFSPESVGAKFYEARGYKNKKDFHGIYDVSHDGYLEISDRNSYIRNNLLDNDVEIDENITKENISKLSDSEINSLADYTNQYSGINYSQVNKYFRTGEGDDDVKNVAKNISSALEKSKVGGDGYVFRGIDASVIGGKELESQIKKLNIAIKRGNIKDATKILQSANSLIGKTFKDKAPMSTNAYYSPSYGQRDVLLVINVNKNTKGLDIKSLSSYGDNKDAWTEKFGSVFNSENEVLLAPNTALKFKKVNLDNKGLIIECDIESQNNNSLTRIQRLNMLLNGGPGSGNFNPGQGRGVGKPANGSNVYKTMVSSTNLTEEEKRYKKYWEDYEGEYVVLSGFDPLDAGYEDEKYEDEELEDGRTFEQARDYFDLMIRKRKFPEDTTVYRRFQFPTKDDLEKAIKNNFVWDGPQATSSSLNPEFLKDSKINPFKLVEDENCLILKINVKKGQSGLALDNSMEEILLPRYSEFKIVKEDEKIDGITSYVVDYVEHTTKENLNSLSFQINGGKGSGNFNPGQGRGVGKPTKGTSKIKKDDAFKVYKKYENRKNPIPKSLSNDERALRINTIKNNAERIGIDLDNASEKDVYKIMTYFGWEDNDKGTVSTNQGLERISDKEISDDDYILFNGTSKKEKYDALRDGGYSSRIYDDDGPGIYTSEMYDIGLEYSKGEGKKSHRERVTPIKINNSNIISRYDVNRKLRTFSKTFLRNLPDSVIAALAGYDAMWNGNDDKEVVILRPSSAEIIELDEE